MSPKKGGCYPETVNYH